MRQERLFVGWLLSQHVLERDDPIGDLATDLWNVVVCTSRPVPRIDTCEDVEAWIGSQVGVSAEAKQAAKEAWEEFIW